MDAPREPESLDEIGRRFDVEVAEAAARTRPNDVEALHWLACMYAQAGRYEESLATDLDVVARAPDRSEFRYDLACSYALLRRADEAFAELSRAVELGFDDGAHLRADPDLDAIRADPRFAALLARVPERDEADGDEDDEA
jgi:thioredoxin-like negative regulator of GroEL